MGCVHVLGRDNAVISDGGQAAIKLDGRFGFWKKSPNEYFFLKKYVLKPAILTSSPFIWPTLSTCFWTLLPLLNIINKNWLNISPYVLTEEMLNFTPSFVSVIEHFTVDVTTPPCINKQTACVALKAEILSEMISECTMAEAVLTKLDTANYHFQNRSYGSNVIQSVGCAQVASIVSE